MNKFLLKMEAHPLPEDVAMLQVMVRELLASNAALAARLEFESRLGLNSTNSVPYFHSVQRQTTR